MTQGVRHPAEEGWRWVKTYFGDIGACLTFVEGASAEQLLNAYGMDAAQADVLLPDQVASRFPEYGPDGAPIPWVQTGVSGDWAFGIEVDSHLGMAWVAGAASKQTTAAVISWTAKPTHWLACYENETCVVRFEPGMDQTVDGSDPGRFRAQMRELEIIEAPPPPPYLPSGRPDYEAMRRQYHDPALKMFGFLTLAFGIRLPGEEAKGPLLTCRLRTDSR